MDFMNRGSRPVQQNAQPQEQGLASPRTPDHKGPKVKNQKLARYGLVVFLAALTILLVAVVALLFTSKDPSSKEFNKVDQTKFQAVFLNGGQVYFGKVTDLTARNLSLSNIYYLRVNQQVQPDQQAAADANDISLVKLGCELHGPQDSMVINREQIIFWENLKDDGQVAKAVAEYVKANPDGQKCDTQNTGGTTNPPATTDQTKNP